MGFVCIALVTAYYFHYQRTSVAGANLLPMHFELEEGDVPIPPRHPPPCSSSDSAHSELEHVQIEDAFDDSVSQSSKLDVLCSIVSDKDLQHVDSRDLSEDLLAGDELLAIHFGHF